MENIVKVSQIICFVFLFFANICYSNDDLEGLRFKDERIKNIWKATVSISSITIESTSPVNIKISYGSGTFIHSDGWILTAKHIITGPPEDVEIFYQLKFSEFYSLKAEKVILNASHDLALIKVDIPPEHKEKLHFAKILHENNLKIGNSINFVRGVLYEDPHYSLPRRECEKILKQGIISSFIKRPGSEWIFSIDADTYPGDSGAGIFTENQNDIVGIYLGVMLKKSELELPVINERYAITTPPIRDFLHSAGLNVNEILINFE